LARIRKGQIADPRAAVIGATGSGVVVGIRWRETDPPADRQLYQVLRLRDGRVVDMQDHPSRGAALKAVGAAA
jgi:hypothetical protein